MYFKKERLEEDPFLNFGKKRKVYHYFFQKGKNLGFDMFLASGKETYLGGLKFKNPTFFDGKDFIIQEKIITADGIYDRSGGMDFPPKKIDRKVLNCSKFKILCNDKNAMYTLLGKYMPKSFEIKSQKKFTEALRNFDESSLIVLKPAKGLGGKGIIIDKKNVLENTILEKGKSYVLQEFADTSCGIKGIAKEKHDLRVVIVEGKIVLSHVRIPKKGSFLANASQGGKIKEVSLDKIPKNVISIVKEIQKIIDKNFGFPLYSIDFGITPKGPRVFELNDQIGFPGDYMKNSKKFINEIMKSLNRLSNN